METKTENLHDSPQWRATIDALLIQMAESQAAFDVLIEYLGLDRRRLNKLLHGEKFFSRNSKHFNAIALQFEKRYRNMLIPYTDSAKRRKP